MAEPTIQLGGGNWAGKTDNLLGYYKEGERFYKQDFTFSRSTTGTYTDSDGYIQEMPYNKLLQSNDFDTTWGNYNSTETYDSNLNAWLIEKTGIYGFIRQFISLSGEQTLSVFAKASTLNWLHIKGSDNSAYFDLENGVLGSYNTTSASIESVGNGFYRCIINYSDDITDVRIYPADGNNDVSGTSGSIYIQNAQLVKGTSAKTYFPTTTRLNIPRVDYLNNSNGSLILEPQRTNVVTESIDFSTYSSQNITTTTNNSTSPDGTINANKATPNTANGQHRYTPSYSVTSSTKYAASVFAKKDGYNKIRITENATTGGYADFDLLNGQVLSTSNVDSAIIEDYGDGWYRCIIVETTGSTSFRFDIIVLDDDNNTSFVGDGTSSVLLWGAMLESGSYSTSYIPTSGSSVTRNSDSCSITNVADRIGQTEGVIFVDFELQTTGEDFVIMNLYNTSSPANGIYFYLNYSRFLNAYCDNGGNQVLIASGVLSEGRFKAAFAYKENDFAFYLNGSLIGVDNSGTVPTCGGLRLENYQNSPTYQEKTKVYQAQIYNTRLTNSELATLTTL